jgi:transmembrane sensor
VRADHVTGVAELREVALPDGSVATLDAGSAIAVDYRDGARGVTLLSGQAFFQVVPDAGRPFRVRADELAVLVTGTAFNVNRTSDAISVSVASGSVEVSTSASGERVRLGPGDRLGFDRQARVSVRGQVPLSHVASWRSRRLVVHDVTVAEVVAELGRHQPGVIVVYDRSLDRQTVSGVFDLSQPHEALNALAESQGARLTQFTPYLQVIAPR